MFGKHTPDVRQPMIIRLWASVVFLLAVTGGAQARGQEPVLAGGACRSCLMWHVPAESAAALDGFGGALQGLTIVVDASAPQAAAALSRIAATGAQPGLIVAASGVPGPSPAAEA